MTPINFHNILQDMAPFFNATERPKELIERVSGEFLGVGSGGLMARYLKQAEPLRMVWAAAARDGIDSQQGYGLFNPSRSKAATAWAYEQFAASDAAIRMERHLKRLIETAAVRESIEGFLIPGDPANRAFMIGRHGLGSMGIDGAVFLQLWPSAGNLARLELATTRAFVYACRPIPHTLSEWLTTEGAAARWVEAIHPEEPHPWLAAFRRPDDEAAALAHIASFYDLPHYDDLVTNIYGAKVQVGAYRPPEALPLTDEESGYVMDVIQSALNSDLPIQQNLIAAYLYGDEIVTEQGHPGLGLPPYAGIEAAYRLVKPCALDDLLRLPSEALLSVN